MVNQLHLLHLHRRAGFGIPPANLSRLSAQPLQTAIANLFDASRPALPLQIVEENTVTLAKVLDMTKEERQMLRKDSREKLRDLNILWLQRMVSGKAALREKMTLFWHGHFACRTFNVFFAQQQNNTLRQHALGSFRELLMAVSKDAAMLQFLNNQQNRKSSPNENFAREVMELFTLGRGNYSETDVKNAARAFTGWGFAAEGKFVFRENQHDFDRKTFLGKTGNFSGEDVLNHILDNRQTARFITIKIYRYFVNDTPNEEIITALTTSFYESDYDISALMRKIAASDWFYDRLNVGTRIKSPVELIAGLQRTFGVQFEQPQSSLLFMQKVLGQVLFYPPNVAGWAEGKNWIDSSSLMFRLRLLQLIFQAADVTTDAKDEGDVNTEYLAKKNGRKLQAHVDWQAFTESFTERDPEKLARELAGFLLSQALSDKQLQIITRQADQSTQPALVKSLSTALLSLPEYQLC